MDVIIITVNSSLQAAYWRSCDFHEKSIILEEDWPGGAGNGLGTLYALQKASRIFEKEEGISLVDYVKKGHSVALYHSAGMGKRLYPLTASEENNKSAIKLPSHEGMTTLIESVVSNTTQLIKKIPGRIFVFWGDQLFLPSKNLQNPASHVEIFSQVLSIPTKEEWESRGLDKYGLLLLSSQKTQLVEKISYEQLFTLLGSPQALESTKIGLSLGSFSLSPKILELLLNAFSNELKEKKGRLNTDYHFWMALTWEKEPYCKFLKEKGYEEKLIEYVYKQMMCIKEELQHESLFSAANIGEGSYWWDFGGLKNYYYHLLSLVEQRPKGEILAELLGVKQFYNPENQSLVINSSVNHLEVKNSILINVMADEVKARESVLINCQLGAAELQEALAYNVRDNQFLRLSSHEVRADVIEEKSGKLLPFYTSLERNGKVDWDVKLPKNICAYRELFL